MDDLHAVTFDQEAAGLSNADVDIVRTDFHRASEADFLHFGSLALGLVGLFLLRLFVLVLAEVHDLAHGRTTVGRDLHEIQSDVVSAALGFIKLNNADHLAFLIEKSNRGDADAVVDARTKVTLVTRGASERSTRRINESVPFC